MLWKYIVLIVIINMIGIQYISALVCWIFFYSIYYTIPTHLQVCKHFSPWESLIGWNTMLKTPPPPPQAANKSPLTCGVGLWFSFQNNAFLWQFFYFFSAMQKSKVSSFGIKKHFCKGNILRFEKHIVFFEKYNRFRPVERNSGRNQWASVGALLGLGLAWPDACGCRSPYAFGTLTVCPPRSGRGGDNPTGKGVRRGYLSNFFL